MANIVLPKHVPDVPELPRHYAQGAPEALHPDQIYHEGQRGYEAFAANAPLKLVADVLGEGSREIVRLDELRGNPHPEDRGATHDRKVRDKVSSFKDSYFPKFNRAKDGLIAELKRLDAELDDKANLKPVAEYRNIIVGTFQSKTPGERAELLADFIKQNDGPTLAVLLEMPLFTTGLSAAQRDSIRPLLLTKIDFQGWQLREHIVATLQKVENAANAIPGVFAALASGTEDGAALRRAQQAALDAERVRLANAR